MQTVRTMGSIFFLDRMPSVTTERVRSALEDTDLDTQLARDLSKRFCFIRAKNRMRTDGLIDEIEETESRWTWQLSRRYRQEQRLGYEFQASFWFDKSSRGVGADNAPLLARVQELFSKYGALYLPSDVTRVVKRIFDRQKGMVRLRHAGSVYFVPRENRGLLRKVGRFVDELGGECLLVPVGLDNEMVREKALEMLSESVRSDLDKIVREMQQLRGEEGMTARKARHRWKSLSGQLDRIRTFARSLSVDARELVSQIRTSELDLSLVANADADVIAALAHAGQIKGALGQIATHLHEGELPPLNSPRVKAAEVILDASRTVDLPALANAPMPLAEVG